jgi:transcriptional regulator with XRE-family HTH domain
VANKQKKFSSSPDTHHPLANQLRKSIHIAMTEQGMDQQQLAAKARIYQPHISAFLCGHRVPSVLVINAMLEALNLKVTVSSK